MDSLFLIFFMGIVVFILLGLMISSAQAAGKSQKKSCTPDGKPNQCQKDCHRYATWTAITSGIIILIMIIIMVIYFFASSSIEEKLKDTVNYAENFVKNNCKELAQGVEHFASSTRDAHVRYGDFFSKYNSK